MKKLVILLAVFLVILSGCAREEKGAVAGADSAYRTITDSLGRTVEIPGHVERIISLGNTTRMIVYLGLADKMVGLCGMSVDKLTPQTAYAYANRELWKDLPIVGTDAYGATNYYPEEIIKARPDIILCTYTKELAEEISAKTGTPVVAVSMGTLFEKDYEKSLRILGDACNVKERAEEVISYINDSLGDLDRRTSAIRDDEKSTALAAAATFKGAHGIEGVYSNYAVFEAINARDAAEGISDYAGGLLVDREKILEWNPDYIFLDSGGVGLVKNDYLENREFFEELDGVSEGNLYQYPSSTSYYSNVEIPLVNAYYAGSILFPDQFGDVDFTEKANDIFRFFLDRDNYLDELKAGGAGYGKVRLD